MGLDRRPGGALAGLLAVNKVDAAPFVGVELDRSVRDRCYPVWTTDCRTVSGIEAVICPREREVPIRP
jgi:urease accessory protein